MKESPKKRPAKPFKGVESSTKPFTKENQPSSESKSAGWTRKRLLRDLLQLTIDGEQPDAKIVKAFIAGYLGKKEKELSDNLTLEQCMDLRLIEKAIKEGDTSAYTAIKDRVYGKPNLQINANVSLANVNLRNFTEAELLEIAEGRMTEKNFEEIFERIKK